MPKKPVEEAAPAPEDDFAPCRAQGVDAKAIGLGREDCPYSSDGPLRDAWLAGYEAE